MIFLRLAWLHSQPRRHPVLEKILLNIYISKHREPFLSSFNRPNLHYDILPKDNAFKELLDILRSTQHKDRAAIIYCFSRKDTESLAGDLRAKGLKAEAYHAGLNPKRTACHS